MGSCRNCHPDASTALRNSVDNTVMPKCGVGWGLGLLGGHVLSHVNVHSLRCAPEVMQRYSVSAVIENKNHGNKIMHLEDFLERARNTRVRWAAEGTSTVTCEGAVSPARAPVSPARAPRAPHHLRGRRRHVPPPGAWAVHARPVIAFTRPARPLLVANPKSVPTLWL